MLSLYLVFCMVARGCARFYASDAIQRMAGALQGAAKLCRRAAGSHWPPFVFKSNTIDLPQFALYTKESTRSRPWREVTHTEKPKVIRNRPTSIVEDSGIV
jgi:hypothetical protein